MPHNAPQHRRKPPSKWQNSPKNRTLTTEEERTVEDMFMRMDHSTIVTRLPYGITGLELTVSDAQTLRGVQWLNDEVMNFYMAMLQKLALKNWEQCKCIFMNTFFYAKLTNNNSLNYDTVKKWTKKAKIRRLTGKRADNIFQLDKVIFPVHVGDMHWCLGVLNLKLKRIEYYDSLGGFSVNFFDHMKEYLIKEHADKMGTEYVLKDWDTYQPGSDPNAPSGDRIPLQKNGSDCGVFACMFAHYVSRGIPFDFRQDDMPHLRKRMLADMLRIPEPGQTRIPS